MRRLEPEPRDARVCVFHGGRRTSGGVREADVPRSASRIAKRLRPKASG